MQYPATTAVIVYTVSAFIGYQLDPGFKAILIWFLGIVTGIVLHAALKQMLDEIKREKDHYEEEDL